MNVFQLGFDQHRTLDVPARTVQGLVPGSAAEKAGLQNDDSVLAVDPMNVDKLRSNVAMRIHLRIRRGDKTLEIDYLPRGGPVEGYQWIRRGGVPDESCANGNGMK
jgi:S1-C subfamily serine protease